MLLSFLLVKWWVGKTRTLPAAEELVMAGEKGKDNDEVSVGVEGFGVHRGASVGEGRWNLDGQQISLCYPC